MTEQNQIHNQIQNLFFSKDTISAFNKIIIHDQSLQNLSRGGKQEIIDLLIKNMKIIYKNINLSKINQSNYPSIFEQFKKISLLQTINDIKKNNIVSNFQQLPSELKLQRDFSSNPNKGNLLMDRPENPRNKQQNNIEPTKINQQNNIFQGFSADMGNYDSSLDAAFKPIVNNLTEQNTFNNYNTGKSSDDVKTRMKSIQESRETELNMREKRPTTPDFLKPKKTSMKQDDDKYNISNDKTITKNNQVIPDFKNINPTQFNNDFNGLSNNIDDNLFSLDNIDKPLIETELIEDNLTFEDRLKKLQSDRNNISQPIQQSNIDFTNPNITQNIQPQEPQYNQTREQTQQTQQPQPTQQTQYKQTREQQEPQYNQTREQTQEPQYKQTREQQEPQYKQTREQTREQQQQTHANKLNELKTSMRSVNIDFKEDKKIKLLYQQNLEKLQYKNNELENIIENLKNELIELKQSNELDKINELKQQIAIEFEKLNNKGEEIENKLKILDTKEVEIGQQLINFNLREIEINKIELNIKDMLKKHDSLFRSQYLQLEVSNVENSSTYTWSMEPINNVTGIKLTSYSLPLPRFNVEENKNNKLSFTLNDEDFNVILNTGKYTIDELIFLLNEKIKTINKKLSISVNKEQKILFESSILTDKINIITTMLSKDNLGFINDTNNTLNKHSYISDNIWDLRIDNKVYLYLNNLSNDIPFGILYFNGESVSQFKFKEPFNLNNLEIIFKDSKGMLYNFYNLPHSLTFLIEK
jgi:hypothetical protein